MKSWSISKILSVTNLQGLWMTRDVNLSESYSSSTPPTSLISPLNGIPLTSSMLATLQELLIQSNHHLLSKGTPHQSQQSSTTKTRQSGCLRRSWIHDIQDQAIAFSTRFTDLVVILILPGITQTVMSFRTCPKPYMNITRNTPTSQVHSLLDWSWFTISQQGQAKKKSRTQSQRSFQTHYSSFTGFSFEKTVSELWGQNLCSKWGVMLGVVPCWSGANLVKVI